MGAVCTAASTLVEASTSPLASVPSDPASGPAPGCGCAEQPASSDTRNTVHERIRYVLSKPWAGGGATQPGEIVRFCRGLGSPYRNRRTPLQLRRCSDPGA